MRRTALRLLLTAFFALAALTPAMAAGNGMVAISGAVDHPASLSLDDLRKLPVTTESIFFHTGHGAVQATYQGASLWAILNKAGITTTPGSRNEGLHKYVVAKGSDGYFTVTALAELDPEFGGQQAILAYAQDGKPLDGARLIMPGDKGGGRNVADVASIELRAAAP